MKSIKTYETKQEYLNDVENLPVPCISYVKETDETFRRSLKEIQIMRAWVDDFGEDWDWQDSDYTFQDYIYDPEYCGSNAYIYTGATYYNGNTTYYLWEREDGNKEMNVSYLLTATDDFTQLQRKSIKYNFEKTGVEDVEIYWNDFHGFIDEDDDYYQEKCPWNNDYIRLVSIEYITIEKIVDEKI